MTTLAERRAAVEESDNAPCADSRVWWRARGTRAELLVDVDGDLWSAHDHSERDRMRPKIETTARVMRGPQDYKTLHLGRGTKWIEPKGKR